MNWKESLLIKIAWLLPKPLVYWCAVRVVSFATTGVYADEKVPSVTAMDALKRWGVRP